ncbi:hypothetical protein CMUS01_10603 [Colletotrichum musicola]|uniref:Uncharacterized protein n=1 Tax=Colletotrichum musicola TaxID=2175873 RepID=A0A8H6K220_9PEZI|nr:hypothetical protein CMUS01_10603 [Colletotrichum musicola]
MVKSRPEDVFGRRTKSRASGSTRHRIHITKWNFLEYEWQSKQAICLYLKKNGYTEMLEPTTRPEIAAGGDEMTSVETRAPAVAHCLTTTPSPTTRLARRFATSWRFWLSKILFDAMGMSDGRKGGPPLSALTL